jgi:hypothetical protein
MQNISATNNLTPNSFDNNSIIFNLAKLKASSKSFDDTNRQLLGTQSRPIICSFNGMGCNINNLKWYWSFEYGSCLQFNSGFNMSNSKVALLDVKEKEKTLVY